MVRLVKYIIALASPASGSAASGSAADTSASQAATPPSTAGNAGQGENAGQGDAAPPSSPSAGRSGNPMVASVEGHPIYLSDIGRAEKALPANLQGMPFQSTFPIVLQRLVDHQALVMLALRRGLEDNPEVKEQIQEARDRVLEGALLAQDAVPKVTEDAIKARYDQLYAGRPATEQVRASHILVATEAAAKKLIADLQNGADFTALAEKYSEDPDGKQGGDLGFFSRDQVWPAFAGVAFSLEPGQVADEPVHNQYGWHVIKVEERREVAPPSYAEVHDRIRNELLQQAVTEEVTLARSQLIIHEWNLDGSEINPKPHLAQPMDSAAAKAKQ